MKNKYQIFQKQDRFGIKNNLSEFKGGNKLKITFKTFDEASQYITFLLESESRIQQNKLKKAVGSRLSDCNVKGVFLELQNFKPIL